MKPDELAATARDDGATPDGEGWGGPSGLVGGRYVIERMLGAGGMGVVFAARDELLHRPVALKVIRSQADRLADARLVREARAMARLSHPNVVQVFDVGEAENGPIYVATELVDGVTLDRWLRERPRSHEEIIEVFAAAGRGLAAAHAAGLVHRDFKPENVMVDRDGRVRVLDFGLARTAGTADTAAPDAPVPAATGLTMTVTGAIAGTPRYMSPEQWRGEPLDARTDQFSFCVALAGALGGRHPFGDTDPAALRDALLGGASPELPATLPGRVVPVLRRGLAHARDDRFASMDDVVRVLAPPERAGRRRRIALALVLAAAAVFASLVALRVHRARSTARALLDVDGNVVGFRCGANYQTYAVETADGARGVRCVRFGDGATPWMIWYGEGLGADGRYRHLGEGHLGGEATAAGLHGNGEDRDDLLQLTLRPADERVPPRRIDVGGAREESWHLTDGWHPGYTSILPDRVRRCGAHLRRYRVYPKRERSHPPGWAVGCVTPSGQTWLESGAWGGEPFMYLGSAGFDELPFSASVCIPGWWCGAHRHGRTGHHRMRRRALPGVGEVLDLSRPYPEDWFPWSRRHAIRIHVVRVVDDASPDALPATAADLERAVRRANEQLAAAGLEVFFIADDAGRDIETYLRSALPASWAEAEAVLAADHSYKVIVFVPAAAPGGCGAERADQPIVLAPPGATGCELAWEDRLGRAIATRLERLLVD